MKYTSHFFAPRNINITISCTSEDDVPTANETIDNELNFCFTDDAPNPTIVESLTAMQKFKRKYRVCDETMLVQEFSTYKYLALYYTGNYDRNQHHKSLKHFLNTHLAPGRKPITHIWRYTLDGQEVEI